MDDNKGIRLDVGCGQTLQEGWTGIDIVPNPYKEMPKDAAYIQQDCFQFPWKVESDSVEEARMIHFFEHVPQQLRFQFMDELYRIMKVGAKCLIICPYYSSMRAVQDPTHMWPPISEASFYYFNKGWRTVNKLDHYGYDVNGTWNYVQCDFDWGGNVSLGAEWVSKARETQEFASAHYINVGSDIVVTITKKANDSK